MPVSTELEDLTREDIEKVQYGELQERLSPIPRGSRMSVTQCPVTTKDRKEMSIIPYASAIGSSMYAMLSTQTNVALAISLTNRFQTNPGKEHWNAVKNIRKYLRRTKDMFLVYGGVGKRSRKQKKLAPTDQSPKIV